MAASDEFAAEYLKTALADGDPIFLRQTFRQVLEARGGQLPELDEETLARLLALDQLLSPLGLQVTFAAKQAA